MLPPIYELVKWGRTVGSRPADDPIGLQLRRDDGTCLFVAMSRAELERMADAIRHRLSAEYDAAFAERGRYAQLPRSSEMSSEAG